MKNRNRRSRWPAFIAWLIGIFILAAGLLIPAWLLPGFVECRGYLEPSDWVAVYAPEDGTVSEGYLADGMEIQAGEVLLILDESWPAYNLQRIERELLSLQGEFAYLTRRLRLFSSHRDIEAGELSRLSEADRLLEAASSVSRSDVIHSEFLYEDFIAGSNREELDLLRALMRNRDARENLKSEERLWHDRVDDCRLTCPVSGTFYTAESVFSGHSTAFLPPLGPGRRLESGNLLGYVVPGDGFEVGIHIPEKEAGRCHTGQRVLLIPDSRPRSSYPPIEGQMILLSPLASFGIVCAVVEIPGLASSASIESGGVLFCGGVTARIDTRGRFSEGYLAGLWERWVLLVNPPGGIGGK